MDMQQKKENKPKRKRIVPVDKLYVLDNEKEVLGSKIYEKVSTIKKNRN